MFHAAPQLFPVSVVSEDVSSTNQVEVVVIAYSFWCCLGVYTCWSARACWVWHVLSVALSWVLSEILARVCIEWILSDWKCTLTVNFRSAVYHSEVFFRLWCNLHVHNLQHLDFRGKWKLNYSVDKLNIPNVSDLKDRLKVMITAEVKRIYLQSISRHCHLSYFKHSMWNDW